MSSRRAIECPSCDGQDDGRCEPPERVGVDGSSGRSEGGGVHGDLRTNVVCHERCVRGRYTVQTESPRPHRSTRDRPAKPPLSQEAVVDAALAILRSEGLEAVSMRGSQPPWTPGRARSTSTWPAATASSRQCSTASPPRSSSSPRIRRAARPGARAPGATPRSARRPSGHRGGNHDEHAHERGSPASTREPLRHPARRRPRRPNRGMDGGRAQRPGHIRRDRVRAAAHDPDALADEVAANFARLPAASPHSSQRTRQNSWPETWTSGSDSRSTPCSTARSPKLAPEYRKKPSVSTTGIAVSTTRRSAPAGIRTPPESRGAEGALLDLRDLDVEGIDAALTRSHVGPSKLGLVVRRETRADAVVPPRRASLAGSAHERHPTPTRIQQSAAHRPTLGALSRPDNPPVAGAGESTAPGRRG